LAQAVTQRNAPLAPGEKVVPPNRFSIEKLPKTVQDAVRAGTIADQREGRGAGLYRYASPDLGHVPQPTFVIGGDSSTDRPGRKQGKQQGSNSIGFAPNHND